MSVARINAKGDGHDIEKHAIGSNHNVIRIWNLDNAGGAPVAETSSSSKIKAMCAHTNLESHFISSSDIYVAYAGDIYEYKDANDSNEVVSYRKNASEPGSYRVRRKSMNNSDTPGFLITIWIQSVLPEDISKEKTFTIRAHCASITALAILDGQTCHNRNNLITNNPLLISGADDKLVKIWNLYTGDPIYVVTIKCDYSMISDVENVTNSFTVGATIPALCVYYPDVSEAETLAIAARGAKNPSEMCDVPHLFIGTEHGIILCYNFDIVQSPSTAESDSHLGDFNCSFVLSKRFKMEGHMDGVNDFAILKQKNEKLERMDKVDRFLLSCGEDKSIIMWDIKRYGTILRTFTGHKGVVQCLCVSHAWENYGEEEVVISASWDHTIAVWNPRDGTLLKSIETPGTVVTVASFSEEITDRNVRKARSYMIYNNSDCGVAMSPIRISHTSLRYYGALYSEDHGYNTIANTTLSAPFHLVASVVKRWPTEENDAHVLKLVSTFDANTPFIQVRYKIDDEVSEHSKNDSIVLSTDNNRFGSVEESEVPFENVPARIKSYDILSKTTSAKSRISTTHKQLLIYSCGLMVKCYQVDIVKHKGSKQLGKSTSGDKLNDSKLHAAGSPAAHFDYSVKETCSVIVAKSSPVLSPPNAPVITPNGTSKKHFSFEDTNNISNYVVDFSVCCSGDVFQQTPVIVVALLDSVLVYLLDPKDLTFSHEKSWVSLKNVDLYTSSFFRAAGQIQCLETYCVNLSDGTGENSKCLHIACGHEGGLISIVHFGEHEYEDKDGVEGILSLSAQVEEAALIATHCSQMRGHQDVVTTISHMPIYNDEGMVKLNCLVSGSKDSTFRVWDVGVEFKELAHGRDVESGVRTITILQHAIDDVKLNRIVVSCENYLIYVWDFDAAAVSVSLSKRLINHSNSVTSVDIINCKALDDCNVFYRSFKSKKKEKSNRAKGVSRPIYLLSSDRKMFNVRIDLCYIFMKIWCKWFAMIHAYVYVLF